MTELYRSEALQRLRNPEQLDSLLRLAHPSAWAILGILAVLIGLTLTWGFLGKIPIRVNGLGVITAAQASIYRLQAQANGIIRSLPVAVGEPAEAGATLATLALPVDEAELMSAEQALELARQQYATQRRFLDEDTALRQQTTQQVEQTLRSVIKDSQEQLQFLRELLELQSAALEKGYYTRQQVESTRSGLFETQQSIAQARDQIAQNRLALSESENQNRRQALELQTAVAQAEAPVKRLRAMLEEEQVIVSPVAGVVTELDIALGALVEAGQVVAIVEQRSDTLSAVGYFGIGQGKQIEPTMESEISPLSVERDRYGSIRAKVESVSRLPVTEDALVARLGNPTLASTLLSAGAPISVNLTLETDPKTASGLRWTSSQGPPVEITPGDTAAMSVVVREIPPIQYVIPLFEAWTRGN